MSTSSKPKSRAPAHANTYAFRHNKNSRLTKRIAQVTTEDLCRKCAEKIEWRKKYRKYKPLTAPRRCNVCSKKTVKAAYRTVCSSCAGKEGRCEGCGKTWAELKEVKKVAAEECEDDSDATQDDDTEDEEM